jgi:hypothetical protein
MRAGSDLLALGQSRGLLPSVFYTVVIAYVIA